VAKPIVNQHKKDFTAKSSIAFAKAMAIKERIHIAFAKATAIKERKRIAFAKAMAIKQSNASPSPRIRRSKRGN
jgi:hypothetical protein